jgi:hypothetical protein
VKSTARPEYAANRVFERCAALSFIRAGQKIAVSTFHYHLAVHLEPLPFRPSTVPTYAGIFPTDFSSTMPSADCLLAMADIAADPLRAVAYFCVSRYGTRDAAATAASCRGIDKPVASLSGVSSRRA